ncbi:MAG: hypothetical protein Q8T08_17400, partial [Ignavibacteria bacterium]|nr:hypothetical protein [Ignavibacteria bacterium]
MKALLALVVSLYFFATCYAQQNEHPAYFHELTFRGEVAYLNNVPFTGLLIEVNTNKPLGIYRNGQKEGSFVGYFENGKKKHEVYYTRGIKNGKEIWWHPNGSKMKEVQIQNNLLNGTMYEWHSNGILKTEMQFSNGKIIDGKYLVSNDEDKEIERFSIKNSYLYEKTGEDRKYEQFYENGNKLYEAYLNESGKPEGVFTEWWPNGTKKTEGCIIDGLLFGKYSTWSESAFKTSEQYYKNGIKDSIAIYWDENGITKTQYIEKDVLIREEIYNPAKLIRNITLK